MALTALIAAYREAEPPAPLRAMIGLAGRMLVERQARLAAQAGAKTILILAERLPGELAAAIDELRRQGLPVRLARTAAEAGELVASDDKVLVIADGAVGELSQFERLAESDSPAVLTGPDSVFAESCERIDADHRWAGLALCTGEILIETSAMLRDWDFMSTLLRRMLQTGAHLIPASANVALLDGEAAAAAFERRLISTAWQVGGSWAARMLAPLERLLSHAVMGSRIGPNALGMVAALLTGSGAALLALGWIRTGYALLLLATPLEGTALRVARIRLQHDTATAWWCLLLPILTGGALIGMGHALMAEHGWGTTLLSLITLAFLAALSIEKGDSLPPGDRWLAERRAMIWTMLPFAAFDGWAYGLAFFIVYAAGSFFWVQRWVHFAKD